MVEQTAAGQAHRPVVGDATDLVLPLQADPSWMLLFPDRRERRKDLVVPLALVPVRLLAVQAAEYPKEQVPGVEAKEVRRVVALLWESIAACVLE